MFFLNSKSSKNKSISRVETPTRSSGKSADINNIDNQIDNTNSRQQQQQILNKDKGRSLKIKTPHPSRIKLNSIVRRLRNLMEYCVNALNEASSTSCSNRFDPKSYEGTIWLLGKYYKLPQDAGDLVADVKSKLWITYRRDFPPIDDQNHYTTDRGFGCMIRCGQMVLANGLIYKNLGREWRWLSSGLQDNPKIYTQILKLFQDKISSPYSIHNIVRIGQQEGKNIGEWFGPNTIAQALRRQTANQLMESATPHELLISIDTALDNIVVIDEIKSKLKRNANQISPSVEASEVSTKNDAIASGTEIYERQTEVSSTEWTPGILFIQLRLGLTKINPLYFAALKKTFQFPHSLGIIGGRPNHALYLIGCADDDIVYLDPHNTQRFIDFDQPPSESATEGSDNFPSWLASGQPTVSGDASYHCECVEKMPLDRLDPSLALCFYFHSEQDLDRWCEMSTQLLIESEQAPMFEITKSRPSDWSSHASGGGVCTRKETGDQVVSLTEVSNIEGDEKFSILRNTDGIRPDEEQESRSNKDATEDEEFEMLG